MKKPSEPNNKKPDSSKSTSAKTRHSKSTKEPVTIDLPPEEVKKKPTRSAVPAARRTSNTKAEAPKAAAPQLDAKTEAKPADVKKETPAAEKKPEPTKPAATTAPAKPTSAPKTSTPSDTNKNGGTGGKLVAGIVGGVIALGGAGAAQYLGLLGAPGTTPTETTASVSPEQLNEARTSLQDRIAALEAELTKQAEAAPQSPAVDMAALQASVNEQIDAKLAELPQPAPPVETDTQALEELQQADQQTASTLEALQTRIASAEQAVGDLQGAINTGGAGEPAALSAVSSQLDQAKQTVADLTQRMTALEEAPTETGASEELTGTVATLNEQVTAVQEQVSNVQSALDSQITALKDEQITPLQQSVEEKTTALTGQVETLAEETQKISALSVRMNELNAQLSTLTEQTAAQSESMTALQEATTVRQQADQQAARAIVAAALKGDMDEGRPFGDTLATLRQVSGDEALLTDLDAYADKGVPTQAQLVARFGPVRDAMEAAITPQSDGSLTSRLLSGAQSLVKVKPLKPIEGETPAARLSQLDGAVSDGDLAEASTLWAAMPEEAKAVSTEWHDDLSARLAANDLVDEAVKSFLLTNAAD